MILRDAIIDDIPYIVDVHLRSFEGFFLTSLGPCFLNELYRAFAFRQDGVLRVICDDQGRVFGFASGTLSPTNFYQSLKRERSLHFLIKAVPSLFRSPKLVIRKLWYGFFYKGEKPSSLQDSALLSSIAIAPERSGESFGSILLRDFELQVKAQNISSIYLTTDKLCNDKVIAFYIKNGYRVDSEFLQADRRSMLRLIKLF